jgi:hypothetical protein
LREAGKRDLGAPLIDSISFFYRMRSQTPAASFPFITKIDSDMFYLCYENRKSVVKGVHIQKASTGQNVMMRSKKNHHMLTQE